MSQPIVIALIATARWIITQVPTWIDDLRAKGELTAEGEAAYQEHQAFIYSKPSAQPSPE